MDRFRAVSPMKESVGVLSGNPDDSVERCNFERRFPSHILERKFLPAGECGAGKKEGDQRSVSHRLSPLTWFRSSTIIFCVNLPVLTFLGLGW